MGKMEANGLTGHSPMSSVKGSGFEQDLNERELHLMKDGQRWV